MKIFWDSGNVGFGGCGINEWDRQVIQELRSRGHQVTIIVDDLLARRPKFKSWRPPEGGFTRIDDKITPYNYRDVVDSLGQFDVQIGNHFTMFPVCEKVLPVVHDVFMKGRKEYSLSTSLTLRGLGTLTNTFACTTPFIAEQVHAALPGSKTECLYAGSKFSGMRKSVTTRGDQKPYIAYWGNRYSKEKNFQNLLKSLLLHPLDLRVSGFFTPSEKELQTVRDLGVQDRVHFHTAMSDENLIDMICNSEMYVCPSTYEGMGLPAMEAMSLGVPVVVSPCAALPGLVGDCGYIAKSYNYKALAESINTCLSEKEQTSLKVRKGLEKSSQWSWGTTVDKLIALI